MPEVVEGKLDRCHKASSTNCSTAIHQCETFELAVAVGVVDERSTGISATVGAKNAVKAGDWFGNCRLVVHDCSCISTGCYY